MFDHISLCHAHQQPLGSRWLNELVQPSATTPEGHLICLLLSWSALTATPAPPYMTALCPSFLFAAAGLHQEVSAHAFSCPSSWRRQSPSTSLNVSLWTKWSSMSAGDFSTGLMFVACSRVRQLQALLFSPPFAYQRLSSLANSSLLKERQQEEKRLLSLQQSPLQPATALLHPPTPPSPQPARACSLMLPLPPTSMDI